MMCRPPGVAMAAVLSSFLVVVVAERDGDVQAVGQVTWSPNHYGVDEQ